MLKYKQFYFHPKYRSPPVISIYCRLVRLVPRLCQSKSLVQANLAPPNQLE